MEVSFKGTKMLTFHRTMKMYRSLFSHHNERISLNLRRKIYGERDVSDTENGPKFHGLQDDRILSSGSLLKYTVINS